MGASGRPNALRSTRKAQRAHLTVIFEALDATGDGLNTLDDAVTRADQVCAASAWTTRPTWRRRGALYVEEYTKGFTSIDPAQDELARAGFDILDTDRDGLISRDELLADMRAALSGAKPA
jgi:hypothetical protein